MRIVYASSPSIGIPCLRTLVDMQLSGADCRVAGVLTNPDSPKKRSGKPEPTEISAECTLLSEKLLEHGHDSIIQLKPEKLDEKAREEVANLRPDLLISFAYGRIFGAKFLNLFPLGGINIHPSLLPKYRGATPIQAAILNRENETGITIQTLALETDAGDILLQERFPLSGRETTARLSECVAQKSGELLREVIVSGKREGKAQTGEISYCARIEKEHGLIDWSLRAEEIDAKIRAYNPWPLTWTTHKDQHLYILEGALYKGKSEIEGSEKEGQVGQVIGTDKEYGILVQTGEGILGITRLQYQTKKALDWRSFLNGARDFTQAILG